MQVVEERRLLENQKMRFVGCKGTGRLKPIGASKWLNESCGRFAVLIDWSRRLSRCFALNALTVWLPTMAVHLSGCF